MSNNHYLYGVKENITKHMTYNHIIRLFVKEFERNQTYTPTPVNSIMRILQKSIVRQIFNNYSSLQQCSISSRTKKLIVKTKVVIPHA